MSVGAFANAVDRLSRGLQALSELALVLLLGLVAHEVFMRYVLDAPTQYSVEFSEYLLVFGPFASLAYVLRRDRHVRVLLAVNFMPRRLQLACAVLANALLVVFCGVVARYGVELAWVAFLGDDRSSSLVAFPLWIPYSFIPIGVLVLGLQSLVHCAEAAQSMRAGADVPAQDD